VKPAFLLDSSACVPVLRNQAGVEGLPDPSLTGIPVTANTGEFQRVEGLKVLDWQPWA
jgi:hypothetical protein